MPTALYAVGIKMKLISEIFLSEHDLDSRRFVKARTG